MMIMMMIMMMMMPAPGDSNTEKRDVENQRTQRIINQQFVDDLVYHLFVLKLTQ